VRSLSQILVPVDFSERAVGAARCAKALADHFHSTLTLLHVIPPSTFDVGPLDAGGALLPELYAARTGQANAELDGFLASELPAPTVQRTVTEGDPAARIVAFAHGHPVDLIVMPTHGYGPFRRFILGSNTAKVLHDADCPVWTGVHMPEAPQAGLPPHRILCAVDLGPQSSKALEWAGWLQREFGAELTLLHVTASSPEPAPGVETRWRSQIREAIAEEFERLQQAAGTSATALIESGETAPAICAAASRIGADLLVIGRGSAAGVFGRLRTNSYAIIREAPCPVVSV
jgi:nucleotide-binding universal stress UspA family protein